MHPPEFRLDHRLSDWPECWLHVHCTRCGGRHSTPAIKMILVQQGDAAFSDLLPRLVCQQCRQRPAPVYLCGSPHRTFHGGPKPDWSIELVPAPRGKP